MAALAADLGAALEIAPSDLAAVLEHCSGASAALALLKLGQADAAAGNGKGAGDDQEYSKEEPGLKKTQADN